MSARDPLGTTPLDAAQVPPEEAGAEPLPEPVPPEPLSGSLPDLAAEPSAGPEAAEPRRGAPVLSLAARKAQRLREREAARAARIAALIAGEEDEAEAARLAAKARARAARQEAREREEAAEWAAQEGNSPERGGPAASESAAARALGGVRPGEGLAAGGRRAERLAGAAVPAPPARRNALRDVPRDALRPVGPSEVRPIPGRAPVAPKAPPLAAPGEVATSPMHRPAAMARPHARHWLVAASFVLLVLLPTALAAWYLWERAAPRFASYAGFSVRTEDTGSAMELLGGMAALAGGSSSSDTDVLYEFIRSQQIVELVDARLDLRALWSKGDPARDPVFTYHAPGTIEDLHDHWNRMVEVYNDGSTGLLDVEVQAFTAEDAQAIAQAVVDESSTLVNRLSDIAQDDATRYAEEELDATVERLKVARAALTTFRNETQIVDPTTAAASQMGLLSQLEGQLAQTLIDLDLLRQTAPDGDPRISQAENRVTVIEERMAAERAKLGLGPSGLPAARPQADPEEDSGGGAFADLVGQYEGLAVDTEIASQAYAAARTAFDAALAESRRQSRYLAAYVQPTLAERAEYPQRVTLTVLVFAFALLAWIILTLAGYALRDRR